MAPLLQYGGAPQPVNFFLASLSLSTMGAGRLAFLSYYLFSTFTPFFITMPL